MGLTELFKKFEGHAQAAMKPLQQQYKQSQQVFGGTPRPPSGSCRSYFLATGYSSDWSSPALTPIQWPYPGNLPPGSLVFSFTHPDPATNEQTRFFLECLPDPVGVAYHAMIFVRHCLTLPGSPPQWRHRIVNIALKDEDGLAWACGSDITISLRWARNILNDFQCGRRDQPGCCFEFKGVILHELVHIVQYDGGGSAPSWLTESIADSVRYMGNLGAKHWKKPGEGKEQRGWEDAYDSGALFLCWLMGETPPRNALPGQPTQAPTPTATGYSNSGGQAMQTQYPGGGDRPPPVPQRPGGPGFDPSRPLKARRGPFPDIVRMIDTRLRSERYSPNWWYEMTGASLEQLWAEYKDYYRN